MLTSDLIPVAHGFFTRNDSDDAVIKKLAVGNLVTATQIHSSLALFITEPGEYVCDALVTNRPGLAIGVYTADCAPVLIHDLNAGLIAAIHAGWRGARYDVISEALNLMKQKGAVNMVAAIGPCIHQNSYEVDVKFISNFRAESGNNEKFFQPSGNEGHFMFDLPAYVKDKLIRAGVEKVDVLNEDTLIQPDKFCSYRRGTISGIREAGRQISAIRL